MPTNRAAFQPRRKASCIQVRDTPYPVAGEGQLVVRTAAIAINPIDHLIQSRGDIMFTHIKYPFILGMDVSGEVVSVGNGVTRIRPGDRVFGLCRSTSAAVNDSAQGAFQSYTVLQEDLTSNITNSEISYPEASVFPLAMLTASSALFDRAQLGLYLPKQQARPSSGKAVIIWGGSSSVGCCAIQLAVAAGYEVYTTASTHNHALMQKLGATQAWDYQDTTVVQEMADELAGKNLVGAVAIGKGAAEKCMEVLVKCKAERKHVAMATFPVPDQEPGFLPVFQIMASFIAWTVAYKLRGLFNGVSSAFVDVEPTIGNGIAKYIFTEYLPKALESGSIIAAPEVQIVGEGLENIQEAMDTLRRGVSAKKLVVTL
uniref:Enoyl reductase (ER) domain-containing protein n=1 Tax=Bionectria ochroleuca TaxID=29856 RepID=A0A8H7TNU9_BIOOC